MDGRRNPRAGQVEAVPFDAGAWEPAGGDGPATVTASCLETRRKSVEGDGLHPDEHKTWVDKIVSTKLVLKRCGCRSRFCEHCCESQGLALRERLRPVFAGFTGVMMITLTVDPQLFESPRAAFDYVRGKRCVAELVRSLWTAGHLHSRRFVVVVEWQKETEMPHWHLVLDATFIPWQGLTACWDRYRPAGAGPVVGERPPFGSVRFSKRDFADAAHAANYICKYIIKHPAHGYPSWVLDYEGQIKRFATSRGLLAGPTWEETEQERAEREAAEAADAAGAALVEHYSDAAHDPGFNPWMWDRGDDQAKPSRTIRERLALCGTATAAVMKTYIACDDGETRERGYGMWVGSVPLSLEEIASLLGLDVQDRELEITSEEWQELYLYTLSRWKWGDKCVAQVRQRDTIEKSRRRELLRVTGGQTLLW